MAKAKKAFRASVRTTTDPPAYQLNPMSHSPLHRESHLIAVRGREPRRPYANPHSQDSARARIYIMDLRAHRASNRHIGMAFLQHVWKSLELAGRLVDSDK